MHDWTPVFVFLCRYHSVGLLFLKGGSLNQRPAWKPVSKLVYSCTVDTQPRYSHTVDPQPQYSYAVDSQPRYSYTVDPQPRYSYTVDPQPQYSYTVDPQPQYSDTVDAQPQYSYTVDPQPQYSDTVDAQPQYSDTVDPQPQYSDTVDAQPQYSDTVDAQPQYSYTVDPQPQYSDTVDPQPQYSYTVDPQPRYSYTVDPQRCTSVWDWPVKHGMKPEVDKQLCFFKFIITKSIHFLSLLLKAEILARYIFTVAIFFTIQRRPFLLNSTPHLLGFCFSCFIRSFLIYMHSLLFNTCIGSWEYLMLYIIW